MLNSHQRCSNSSIFCINAKTCTTRNLHEVPQARTYQRNICENFAWFLYYPCSHRTLFWSSGWCHWRQWPDISAEREPVGHPWQFKVKKMKDMRERSFLILINWIMEGWCLVHSGRELLCAGTLNVCEAFVMTCRQAAVIKPTVWGVAEFGRLAANKRMHGVENAVLFNVPHIWSPSRNTSNKLQYPLSLIYRKYFKHILLSKIYIAFSES